MTQRLLNRTCIRSQLLRGLMLGGFVALPALTAGNALAAFDCKDDEIVIGSARAKTGGFAFFDETGRKGMAVAVDQINAAGGIDGCMVRMAEGDTQSNPALAGQVAEELIQSGADIILAPADFDIGVGASLSAQQAGLFALSPEAASTAWTQAVGPNFITGATTIESIGTGIAQFANQRGWKKAYVATNAAFNYFTQQEQTFNEVYDGDVVGRDELADNASDYAAVVSKIRSADPQPDFLYLNDYFPHVGTFIKQLRAAGVTLPVVGNGSYSSSALPEVIGAEAIQDVYYISNAYYEGADADPGVLEFVRKYNEKFGANPENTNALLAYYNGLILAEGLKKAGSTDAAKLTEAITGQSDLALPGATYYGWSDRTPLTSQAIIGFTPEGKFRLVEMIDVRGSN